MISNAETDDIKAASGGACRPRSSWSRWEYELYFVGRSIRSLRSKIPAEKYNPSRQSQLQRELDGFLALVPVLREECRRCKLGVTN